MNDRSFDNMLQRLKSAYQWTELNHAWRFNGIVDVWKHPGNVFCKTETQKEYFRSCPDMEAWIVERLRKYPAQHAYAEGVSNGKMYYREFTHVKKENNNRLDTRQAEDYHWERFGAEVSDDHLYFLFHDGFLKIGRSGNIDARVDQLKTSLSTDFHVIVITNRGGMEKTFHRCFSDFKSKREWFRNDPRIVTFLNKRLEDGSAYRWNPVAAPLMQYPENGTHSIIKGVVRWKRNTGAMRLVIAGDREFEHYDIIKQKLDEILHDCKPDRIFIGTSRGIDDMAAEYAEAAEIKTLIFAPDWDKFQKRAAFVRDDEMMHDATHCIVFVNRITRAGEYIATLARKKRIPVQVVDVDDLYIELGYLSQSETAKWKKKFGL